MADTAFRGAGGTGGCGSGGSGISSHIGGGSGAIPWASKAGHVETVFSCEHRPGDPDTLATGSYGSSVKVWHVPTMDLKVRALDGIASDRMARCFLLNQTPENLLAKTGHTAYGEFFHAHQVQYSAPRLFATSPKGKKIQCHSTML